MALSTVGLSAAAKSQPPTAPLPVVKGLAAILVDADTGKVLFSKNADLARPPASTTKIMTAILLMENTHPTDLITASKKAADTEGSSLHLKPGETIAAGDLLYALVMRSANDACVAAAEHISGSVQSFAQLMTRRARELGANHTIFRNPNGLNSPPNSTTARDLAIMARFASTFPQFDLVTRTRSFVISRTQNKHDVHLRSHAWFLWKFPGADGIKTGFTNPAGHCFVGAATWNGWRLISVVLRTPDMVGDTARMMKFGFYHFARQEIAPAGRTEALVPVRNGLRTTVPVGLSRPLYYIVPAGTHVAAKVRMQLRRVVAPVRFGDIVGTASAYVDGKRADSVRVVSRASDSLSSASDLRRGYTAWVMLPLGSAIVLYATKVTKNSRRSRYRLKA